MDFWISAWGTLPERLKGAKDEVKQQLDPKGRHLKVRARRAPRLLVDNNSEKIVLLLFQMKHYITN